MRKAAFVIGIICAVFAVLATVLRFIGFPGGSLLYIGFTSLFSVVSVGLHLGSLFKESTDRTRRIALVVFWFGLVDLQVGLLYAAMRWDGTLSILLQALMMNVAAVILLIISAKKPSVTTKWFSSYTIVAVVIYVSLVVGWLLAGEKRVFGVEHSQAYYSELADYTAANIKYDSDRKAFCSDTTNALVLNDANHYFDQMELLLLEIENIKARLIEEQNSYYSSEKLRRTEVLKHPEAYDYSTMLLVGADVQHPNGIGMELYRALADYRTNDLHPEVAFGVPVSNDSVQKEQWVKDNFYHLPAIDAMTRLTVIQNNVVQSALISIDKKLFVKQQ